MNPRLRAGARWASNHPVVTLGVAAAIAGGVRVAALYGIGASNHPPYFDEGAYFTAAALWARGWIPHRDFILVHPPGTTYLLAPLTLIGSPSTAFLVARTAMTIVGGLNAFMIGLIARKLAPLWACCAGTLLYAVIPEAVLADQKIVIEPLLNLACLGVVMVWLGGEPGDRLLSRRVLATGVLFGVAASFKFWAGFLIIPLLVTATAGRRLRQVGVVGATGIMTWALLAAPLAVPAPGEFFRQVVAFQLTRSDGSPVTPVGRLLRVLIDPFELPRGRTVVETLVVFAVLATLATRPTMSRGAKFVVAWLATILAALVAAPLHKNPYNAHLAPAAALCAAWVLAAWFQRRAPVAVPASEGATLDAAVASSSPLHRRWAAWLVALAFLLAALQAAGSVVRNARTPNDSGERIGALVERLGPCVFSFEPAWLVMGDRFPDPGLVGVAATDYYVTGLIAGAGEPRRADPFATPGARRVLRAAVESCPVVLVGRSGRDALASQWSWFEARYVRVAETGENGPDVWRRRVVGSVGGVTDVGGGN